MGHRYAQIAFTPSVKALQEENGSRKSYARMEDGEDFNHLIGDQERAFLAQQDSLYMATVSETGWPYIQHRGGPPGFVRVLDERTLGFADFRGNKQYISTGNLGKDDRVALFFMDYPRRKRLKLLARMRAVPLDNHEILEKLGVDDYGARVERGFVIEVEGFDWNCPQHITPRFTEDEISRMTAPLLEELTALRSKLALLDPEFLDPRG